MKETKEMLTKAIEEQATDPYPNQTVVDGLRKAADYLEANPGLPYFGEQSIRMWLYDKEELRAVAKELGSFKKEADDHFFRLISPVNEEVEFLFTISRDTICKKVVTWDCPDDLVSLLREDEDVVTVDD